MAKLEEDDFDNEVGEQQIECNLSNAFAKSEREEGARGGDVFSMSPACRRFFVVSLFLLLGEEGGGDEVEDTEEIDADCTEDDGVGIAQEDGDVDIGTSLDDGTGFFFIFFCFCLSILFFSSEIVVVVVVDDDNDDDESSIIAVTAAAASFSASSSPSKT